MPKTHEKDISLRCRCRITLCMFTLLENKKVTWVGINIFISYIHLCFCLDGV